MRSLRPLEASGLYNPLHNPTPHPTTDYPFRRVCTEHRRVLVGNLTARNPFLAPNTVAIVGFVGFCEKV
jgi:hypothetical protein